MAKILIVEDQDDIREVEEMHLEMYDHEIYQATNGKEGVEMALFIRPDLIIMDMHMPIMNGHEAVDALRRQHGYTGKIVAVTASVMKSDTALSTESGCNGFIPKPIGDDFGDIIAEFLKGENNG